MTPWGYYQEIQTVENSTFYSIDKRSVHILYCLYINFRRIAEFTVFVLVHLFELIFCKLLWFSFVYPF